MINKILGSWILQLFCIFWAAFLYLDYFNASSYFTEAFKYFDYLGFVVVALLLIGGFTYLFSKQYKFGLNVEISGFKNIYHYVFLLMAMTLIMMFYIIKTDIVDSIFGGVFIFIIKTVLFHIGLALIFLSSISLGAVILNIFPFKPDENVFHWVASGIGFVVLTFILFLLGSVHLLYNFIVIPLLLGFIILKWKYLLSTSKKLLFTKAPNFKINVFSILIYSFIIILAALNLTYTTRPFPIGFDDLNLYMRIPKLLAGYHALTSGGYPYNWSLIMSLGFVVFNNPVITILLSVTPGILCVLLISRICLDMKLDRNWTLLVCMIFFTYPNTIWQSRNDAKTDLAMLFITLCALLIALRPLSKVNINKPNFITKWLGKLKSEEVSIILIGLLLGYAFGIKFVAMLSVFAMLVLLFYQNAGKQGAIAMFAFIFVVIFALDLTSFAAFIREGLFIKVLGFLIISIVFFAILFFKQRQNLLKAVRLSFLFLLTISITFLPWAIKNVNENRNISFSSILKGETKRPQIFLFDNTKPTGYIDENIGNARVHQNNKKVTHFESGSFLTSSTSEFVSRIFSHKSDEQSVGSSGSDKTPDVVESTDMNEEVRRYLGYESGLIRFISLPYDIIMKNNVRLWSADIGVLVILLLSFLIFNYYSKKLFYNIIKIGTLLILLIFSIYSSYVVNHSVDLAAVFKEMESKYISDQNFIFSLFQKIYLHSKFFLLAMGDKLNAFYNLFTVQPLKFCFIIIPFFSIPIYFLFRHRISTLTDSSKALVLFSYTILIIWLILSSGIVWYGIVGFAVLPIGIALFINNLPETELSSRKFMDRFVLICSAIWLVLIFPFQFMPIKFMAVKDRNLVNLTEFLEPSFAKFAVGKSDEKTTFKEFFSQAEQNIIQTLNRDKKARIFNVTTFLPYYIDNNDIRVYDDNQLGIFDKVYKSSNGDEAEIINMFKAEKIRYVLIGLNAPDIDMTPEKTLRKKFNNLMNTLVNQPNARMLYTNRIMERPDGNMQININGEIKVAKYDILGVRIIDPGTVVLFELMN